MTSKLRREAIRPQRCGYGAAIGRLTFLGIMVFSAGVIASVDEAGSALFFVSLAAALIVADLVWNSSRA